MTEGNPFREGHRAAPKYSAWVSLVRNGGNSLCLIFCMRFFLQWKIPDAIMKTMDTKRKKVLL